MLQNFRLRVFRAVAEHLSFRKAGEALYLTQPAVTLQIKALEDELGKKLFERSASGVRLTEAGKILLPYVDRLHELAAEAENRLAELAGGATGELAMGASTTIAQYVLPTLLAEFSRSFPAVRLQVFSDNSEQIAEGVATGRFRIGLIEGPAFRADVKTLRWFDDELFLVVPRAHEWAGLNTIGGQALLQAPLVMRERGSGSRHVVEQALQKAGLRLKALRIVMELDSTEAILSCIEAGLGIGFASEWALTRRLQSGSLATLRIQDHMITRSFSLVLPHGPEPADAASLMLTFLQARVPPPSAGKQPDGGLAAKPARTAKPRAPKR